MGQNFINSFSWVNLHGLYYIMKNGNQIWWSFVFFKLNIPFLTRMTQNWTKITTAKNEDD